MDERLCLKCKSMKPLSEFAQWKSVRRGIVVITKSGWCKACRKIYKTKYYSLNREFVLLAAKKYCKKNKKAISRRRSASYPLNRRKEKNRQLRKSYGITIEQYGEILTLQKGVCAICGTDTPAVNRNYFYVDHCHDTGIVRGLLCNNCNRALGNLKNSSVIAERAARYLDNYDAVFNFLYPPTKQL